MLGSNAGYRTPGGSSRWYGLLLQATEVQGNLGPKCHLLSQPVPFEVSQDWALIGATTLHSLQPSWACSGSTVTTDDGPFQSCHRGSLALMCLKCLCSQLLFFPSLGAGDLGWRPGFSPWVGKIPWRRTWQPTPVVLPGGAWRATVHGVAKGQTWLSD